VWLSRRLAAACFHCGIPHSPWSHRCPCFSSCPGDGDLQRVLIRVCAEAGAALLACAGAGGMKQHQKHKPLDSEHLHASINLFCFSRFVLPLVAGSLFVFLSWSIDGLRWQRVVVVPVP
jgi:hypothetical protein